MGSSTVLDLLGSAAVFGILLLTVGRVQVNLNSTLYYNTYTYMTQNYALELSKIIEHDFTKIGYRIPAGTAAIDTADTNRIQFSYRYPRVDGSHRTVRYRLGPSDATSQNPRDSILYRTENSATTAFTIGLTEFRLTYLDSLYRTMSTPITTLARADSIYAIRVYYKVQSFEPVVVTGEPQYISVIWDKLIYPRNISAIR
jgi:hypothetical protein